MKNIVLISIILLSISTGYTNDKSSLKPPDYKYEATVLGKGMDCDEVFLIDLVNLEENSGLANAVYYADNLKPEFKIEGLKLILNCRKPTQDELYSCTCEGPGYSHVIVLACETVKEND